MNNKKEILRVIKFTLFSISAGIIQILVFTILNEVLKLNYTICYLTALVASVIWNFTLNREFTFKSANNIPVAMAKTFVFYLFFTPISTILGTYFVDKLFVNEYIVTGVNMICNFVLEFIYDKFYVFKGTIDTKEKK